MRTAQGIRRLKDADSLSNPVRRSYAEACGEVHKRQMACGVRRFRPIGIRVLTDTFLRLPLPGHALIAR